ncbi:MAG: 2-succinyl-5-enolpyruvyl-6-hydroxy-3-cyclohexene-1-carboxylic-acid synthase [Deltaproteobacteria bacterium]|nr:2-succinyl-5-enolpyruvyl-6-hydroxy-3-cyclohexene-1-carboxylic-acid synthase [Deltaproteobacteria bacterium]
MTPNECLSYWLVEELVAQGISQFCISPGSRSTPLTVAAARHPKANTKIFLDERAAAYFALGWSRATDQAAALICTSGTAGANYYPAIIEASIEHLPLLAITADRPPELQQTGANQTVEQNQLFGSHTRWFYDPGCPDQTLQESTVKSWAAQAVLRSAYPDPGPVHLNIPFREPFLADEQSSLLKVTSPNFQLGIPRQSLAKEDLQALRPILKTDRGLVTVGELPFRAQLSVGNFLEKLNWPVFADTTSGFRFGNLSQRIDLADQLLLQDQWRKAVPEVWIHLGNQCVSKRWLQWWQDCKSTHKIVLTNHSNRQDPSQRPHWRLQLDWEALDEILSSTEVSSSRTQWLEQWKQGSQALEEQAARWWDKTERFGEVSIVRELVCQIPIEHALFVGNSLPIREVDMLSTTRNTPLRIAANRGASGIDGQIATACGWAMGHRQPTTILLGDLSAMHDLNSLLLIRESTVPMTLIILNNDGGGIFSMLPIYKQKDVFESFFGTPHGCEFSKVAAMFDIPCFQPENLEQLCKSYQEAWHSKKSSLIEVKTGREQTAAQLLAWQEHVKNHA